MSKKKCDKLIKQVNETLYKRDELIFKVITAESSVSRSFSAISFLHNELQLHSLLNKKTLKQAVANLKDEKNGVRRQHLKRIQHHQTHHSSASKMEIIRKSMTMSASEKSWRKAREKGNYWSLSGAFERLVNISKKLGARKAKKLGTDSAYHALMDEFDPGRDAEHFDNIVNDITDYLRPKVKNIPTEDTDSDADKGLWSLPKHIQEELCKKILDHIGVDMDSLDYSEGPHPTCFGQKNRILMTMSYDEDNFIIAALAAVHEGGHALFRQHTPDKYLDGPAAEVSSQSTDEAMALIFENAYGHGKGFAEWLLKTLKEDFGIADKDMTADKLHEQLNKQNLSMIRIETGEVAYPLHIVLRYNVARDMIDGDLTPNMMPIRWSTQEYVLFDNPEFEPSNALQDIHWYGGKIGYFPCYLSGTLMAAQMLEKAMDDNPDIQKGIDNFDTKPLLDWLIDNVYSETPKLTSDELIEKVTGKKLDIEAYKKRIEKLPFMADNNNNKTADASQHKTPKPHAPKH